MLCVGAHAQKTDTLLVPKTSGYLSIGLGATLAVGPYAGTTGNGFGQYAQAGLSRFISGAVIVNKIRLGFVINYGAFNSTFNANKYVANLKSPDSLKNTQFGKQPASGNLYTGAYGMFGFMGEIRIKKFAIDIRVMGGRLTTFFPELAYYESGINNAGKFVNTNYDYLSTETFSLGLDAGLNARYTIKKHFCVMINADYLYSKFYYGTVENISNQPVGNECVVSLFNFTAAAAYQF